MPENYLCFFLRLGISCINLVEMRDLMEQVKDEIILAYLKVRIGLSNRF